MEGLSLDPLWIRGGGNSGYQAVNLAVHLGAKKIVLIGFDMKGSGGKVHWHDAHPPGMNNPRDGRFIVVPTADGGTQRIFSKGNFENWCETFATAVPDLERAGVEVVNATEVSALTVFPMARLEDVL